MLVHTSCIPNVSLTCEADNKRVSDDSNKIPQIKTTVTETTDEVSFYDNIFF